MYTIMPPIKKSNVPNTPSITAMKIVSITNQGSCSGLQVEISAVVEML